MIVTHQGLNTRLAISPAFNTNVFNRPGVPSRGREVTVTVNLKF
jgi:hypothetical protein